MSDRERWIVYPLLFLCFMLAAKEQILVFLQLEVPQNVRFARVIADSIVCTQMRAASITDISGMVFDILKFTPGDLRALKFVVGGFEKPFDQRFGLGMIHFKAIHTH